MTTRRANALVVLALLAAPVAAAIALPTRDEPVVNLPTATALKPAIPESVLARADRVIQ